GLAEPRESAGRHRAGCAGSAPDAAPVPAGRRRERALMSDFHPADSFRSPRFAQPATFMRLPQTRDYAQLDVALLGIPFDGGTSYRPGPRFGPRDIRQHSSLIRPYNPLLKVSPFEVVRVADVGDVDVNPVNIEDTYGRVVQIGSRGPVDAETDFDFGRKHGVRTITAEQVAHEGLAWVKEQILTLRRGPVYVSFDIDGVDPAFAPGTGTPEVGGLTSREALELVRALVGVQLVGADVVEVSPPYDHAGITSMLAANILFEMLSVIAATRLQTQEMKPRKGKA